MARREILSQSKQWKPKEYFVYFKVFIVQMLRQKSRCDMRIISQS